MVQPSSGSVGPKMRETIAITAIAQEERKGSISVHTDTETQAIAFHVLPLKFTVEPDKIKFAHSGTEQRISLKNHMDAKLLWEVKESDSNFFLSLKAGELHPENPLTYPSAFNPEAPAYKLRKLSASSERGAVHQEEDPF
ncbi:Uncharacterized protein FKW44_018350 [Caligus rogercresseyi]|uniref:Uncharacterized protein n=1 Tax=Caligus rogercresseyi TaxID=217165 RepID=A0A7T8JXC5_CALRO|nr:Uncharacterized protein FKW44_018350 [Caligus rogercresseyi]